MKYRVILAFETYSVGNVIEPTGLWADELKRRKYIEPLIEASPEPDKPKRGRPRKDDVHRV